MNPFLKNVRHRFALLGIALAFLITTGCETTAPAGRSDASIAPPAPALASPGSASSDQTGDKLQVGDPMTIVFSGVIDPPPAVNERIKADGTLNLPLLDKPIVAAGKTRGELEQEIEKRYVPNFYRRLTVKVGSESRYVTVSGEVRSPTRVPYLGPTTVLKVIAAAGDFTDFAKKKSVQITRANGRKETVNCLKAQRDPKFDLPVYPDDLVHVPRRLF